MPKSTKYNLKWEKLPECQGLLSALKLKDNRSELTFTRIRSLMLIKFNCNQFCLEFFHSIKEKHDILHAISSGEKYIESKSRMEHRALQLNKGQPSDDDDCCEEH